jgi:hypothetical protein
MSSLSTETDTGATPAIQIFSDSRSQDESYVFALAHSRLHAKRVYFVPEEQMEGANLAFISRKMLSVSLPFTTAGSISQIISISNTTLLVSVTQPVLRATGTVGNKKSLLYLLRLNDPDGKKFEFI